MSGRESDAWVYRPAADHGLTFSERNQSLDCEAGLFRRAVQAGTWALLRRYFRHVHHFCVAGLRNLPAHGPFVLVANHSSHLDALALAASVPPRRATDVTLLAAGDTFFCSPGRAAMASIGLNARPVWRGRCGAKALAKLRSNLQSTGRGGGRGPIYVIFPEGTRSRSGKMARFKPGVGTMVAGTRIPVVPVCISGAFAAWPPGSARPRRCPITLRIGPAVTFEDVENHHHGWRTVAAQLEDRVRFLQKCAPRPNRPSRITNTRMATLHTV